MSATSYTIHPPSLEEDRFLVEGMDCAACVTNIERAIKKLPGIEKASVSLATGEAAVAFDPHKVDLSKIKHAVDGIGYKAIDFPAEDIHSHHQAESEKLYRQRKIKFFVALTLTLPVFIISMFELECAGSMWLQLLLASPVGLWCGEHFLNGG